MIDLRGKTVYVLSENDTILPGDLVRPLFGESLDFMLRDDVHAWIPVEHELPFWIDKTLMDFHMFGLDNAEDWQDKTYIHLHEIVRIK